ncbi:unnamed protein product [Closterium sp. NIES-54]
MLISLPLSMHLWRLPSFPAPRLPVSPASMLPVSLSPQLPCSPSPPTLSPHHRPCRLPHPPNLTPLSLPSPPRGHTAPHCTTLSHTAATTRGGGAEVAAGAGAAPEQAPQVTRDGL